MQPVPLIDGEAVAAQLGEAGDVPDVGRDVTELLEQDGGGLDLAQDCARAEELDPVRAVTPAPERSRYMPRQMPSSTSGSAG